MDDINRVFQHRTWGFEMEVLGKGDPRTGLCTVKRLEDGKIFEGVHYSELHGNACHREEAFYGMLRLVFHSKKRQRKTKHPLDAKRRKA